MPVRSVTIVWKLISASSRPWVISGWYGVYAVYHAGILEHVAQDHGRRDRVVVAETDQRREHFVARRRAHATARSASVSLHASPIASSSSERIVAGTAARPTRRVSRSRASPTSRAGRLRSDRCGDRRIPSRASHLEHLRAAGLSRAVARAPPLSRPLQRCLAPTVRVPERFRGGLLLRRPDPVPSQLEPVRDSPVEVDGK